MARRRPTDDADPKDRPEPEAPPADDPDRSIRRGGPGEPPAEPEPEPAPDPAPATAARTRVKIGRREFDVDSDLAEAVQEREKDYMRGIQMDRREREELDRYRRAAQPTPPQSQEPDWNTLLFENPTKALELRDRALEARLERKYNTAQTEQRLWQKFYADNPDLADEQVLVEATLTSALRSSDYDEIADSPTTKAMELLADRVRSHILRISRKAKGTGTVTPLPTNRATVEGATGDRTPAAPRARNEEEEPSSMSAEIKRRAQRRRAAARGA